MLVRAFVAAVVLIALNVPGTGAASPPMLTGPMRAFRPAVAPVAANGVISYDRSIPGEPGDNAIFIANPDGSDQRRVTPYSTELEDRADGLVGGWHDAGLRGP
jgi:hypothetical protein